MNRFVQPIEAVPSARIGVHKPELIMPNLDAAAAERHRDAAKWAIIDYLTRMGADATLAMRMFEVRHESMEFIRERDFALWRLATSFSRPLWP
ncbi:hypothetical protein [Sabulicella rubraurantiaca]|uniref:hypothetical protein n=1 Tax=Sabulicella rubraurantiaca TaxID=2811429 RepID=UPI001A972510|nr:hypothetical protein [Sabulicella rubraurantiaca]